MHTVILNHKMVWYSDKYTLNITYTVCFLSKMFGIPDH